MQLGKIEMPWFCLSRKPNGRIRISLCLPVLQAPGQAAFTTRAGSRSRNFARDRKFRIRRPVA